MNRPFLSRFLSPSFAPLFRALASQPDRHVRRGCARVGAAVDLRALLRRRRKRRRLVLRRAVRGARLAARRPYPRGRERIGRSRHPLDPPFWCDPRRRALRPRGRGRKRDDPRAECRRRRELRFPERPGLGRPAGCRRSCGRGGLRGLRRGGRIRWRGYARTRRARRQQPRALVRGRRHGRQRLRLHDPGRADARQCSPDGSRAWNGRALRLGPAGGRGDGPKAWPQGFPTCGVRS